MATSRASAVTNCSICGEPLNAKGDCVACLLRRGLGGSIAENGPSASLVFGDFEVARREDGSFWELGRGAFGVTYLAVDNVLRRRVALKVIDVPAGLRAVHTLCANAFCGKPALPPLCGIPMWPPFISSVLRPMAVAVSTQWSWSRAKHWRLACVGMVPSIQNSLSKSQSKSRAH